MRSIKEVVTCEKYFCFTVKPTTNLPRLVQANQGIFQTMCDGCGQSCEGCSSCELNGVQMAPECVSLADAGLAHASSSGGIVTINELEIDEEYSRTTPNSTHIFECFDVDTGQGGATGAPNFCRPGYEEPCKLRIPLFKQHESRGVDFIA